MRAVVLFSLFVLTGAAAACSATSGNHFTVGAGSGGAGGAGTGGSSNLGGGFATTGTGVGAGGPGCSAAAQLVYVLALPNPLHPQEQGHIWSFAPDTQALTDLFALPCNLPVDPQDTVNQFQWSPNSMAVDRGAVAWVNYVRTDTFASPNVDDMGVIFKVDIVKHTCEATPAVTLPDPSWYRLGMGFSADMAGGSSETLYVAGTASKGLGTGPGLGRIDPATKTVVPIGQFTGAGNGLAGQSAELTGTGDGRLYGFFTLYDAAMGPVPVHVAQIDKSDGSTPAATDMTLAALTTPGAWAFSFWGGSFYLYTATGAAHSNVTHYDPKTNLVDTGFFDDVGFVIVGAGVSTCAPLKPVN